MDTITHGIAGALIGKAVFRGDDMLALRAMNRGRIITWSLMLGAIFPDSDVFREIFSRNPLLILTWHRSITHSLVCLPIFALLLAALTRWVARWCKWDAPSLAFLTFIYAVGILSHILLDLVTSFGTMIWSPLKWSRPAWDLIFIIDFTLSGILLVPQIVAWAYAKREGLQRRALGAWLVFSAVAVGVYAIARIVDAPISLGATLATIVVLAALFLLPAIRFWGLRVSRAAWNFAGLLVALGYVCLAIFFHQAALARVNKFAGLEQLDVQSIGALPLPPSLWHWDGLVRTPRGVYETRIHFSGAADQVEAAPRDQSGQAGGIPLEYRYYPDAPPNAYIDAAKRLPEVQTFLWFARFPVTRFHKEGSDAVVEFLDLRFPQVRRDRPAAFTYRVRFGAAGNVLSQGWVKD
jgi:membrane-bound metal-dependent hydrolase YbcI (DUF457 family)